MSHLVELNLFRHRRRRRRRRRALSLLALVGGVVHDMKRAELGLLEVLGLLVECRGKVMSRLSPCFARELGILLCYLILRPFLSFFTQSIPCLRLRKVILGRSSFLCEGFKL